MISPSDPRSAWTAKANKRVQFGYGLNYLIDMGYRGGVPRGGDSELGRHFRQRLVLGSTHAAEPEHLGRGYASSDRKAALHTE